MADVLIPVMVVGMLFIGLPWLILHYVTKWKSNGTMPVEDERLLEELYELARRLDDRVHTVERLVAADNPDWRPALRDRSRSDDDRLTDERDDEPRRLYRPERNN